MSEIYKDCPWCKGQGVSEYRGRRRWRQWGSSGPRVPCTFCSVEREKEEQRKKDRAQAHFERTGDYCDPNFNEYVGQIAYLDLKTGKTTLLGDVQELEGGDVPPTPPRLPNCGCCGRPSEGQTWCDDCEGHIDPGKPYFEQSYYSQYHEDCPFQIPHPWWV